jgi:hypothetical protein
MRVSVCVSKKLREKDEDEEEEEELVVVNGADGWTDGWNPVDGLRAAQVMIH